LTDTTGSIKLPEYYPGGCEKRYQTNTARIGNSGDLILKERIGNYEILKKMAIGGMAEILLARQVGLMGFERLVVIKRILPHLVCEESFTQMFLNEARLAARFNHPNIVQIYDLGRQDDTFYIAMEFIQGEDLKNIIRRCTKKDRRIPLEHVVKIMSGVLDGLHYAHTQPDLEGKTGGVVHRDVSPRNVILSFQGGVKLLDFGIAKAQKQISTTMPGRIKGKHAYMSPEQCHGLELDGRSDIFSAGVVMYESIAWKRLFKRTSNFETLKAVVSADIPPLRGCVSDLDPKLEAIVMRALQRDREKRYQTAQEMQVDLEDYLISKGWKSNSVLLSRFMGDLFQDKLELMNKALGDANFENLEKAVLSPKKDNVDLEEFLNKFFPEASPEKNGSRSSSSQSDETNSDELLMVPMETPDSQPNQPSTVVVSGEIMEEKPAKGPVLEGMDLLSFVPTGGASASSPPLAKALVVEEKIPTPNPPSPDVRADPFDSREMDLMLDPFLPKPRKGRGLFLIVVLLFLAVGGVVLFWFLGKGSSAPSKPKGVVKMSSVPPGASVYLDDVVQPGKSPIELNLPVGEEHVVRMELTEFPVWEQKVLLTDPTKPLDLRIVFDKNIEKKALLAGEPIIAGAQGEGTGTIQVASDPKNALIYLDGISTDKKTPALLRGVPAGLDHVVLLELSGREATAFRLRLEAGQNAVVQLTPKESTQVDDGRTTVSIESDPEGAKVIVNEWPLSKKTPIPVKLLNGTPSEIVIELDGYHKWRKVVRPIVGVDLTFFAKLKKK
jgi:eukaryotic-like serine/threonine-protein kinase